MDLVKEITDAKMISRELSSYAQGSPVIVSDSESDNCDTNYNIDLDIVVPTNTIAVKNMNLYYNVDSYRVFHTTTPSGGGDTTVSGGGSTSGDATPTATSGASFWTTYTVDYVALGNYKANCYSWETLVGSPDYYTTRVGIVLLNVTGGSVNVTPKCTLPSTTTITFATNFSASNNTAYAWTSGETSSSNKTGYFSFWDDNYACSACTGTVENVYSHTHGTHSHTTPDHTHATPNHVHDITYGISEIAAEGSNVISVYVDTTNITSLIEADYGTLSTSLMNEINLAKYFTFEAGKRYTLSVRPIKKCWIHAGVQGELFIKSGG